MILFLVACGNNIDTGREEMPMEVVNCTHPDSRFEGVVQVEVEDSIQWESVHFKITQNDNVWNTQLQTEDQYLWWTRMQLYELNCYNPFETEVYYESW